MSQLIIQWDLLSAGYVSGYVLAAKSAVMNQTDDSFPALMEFTVWGETTNKNAIKSYDPFSVAPENGIL